VAGNEYADVAGAWDWNLIPGITTDYGNTPLSCSTIDYAGLSPIVGGVSDSVRGIGLMTYKNPLTEAFSFQKAWFFLDNDVQYVMVSDIASSSSAPVFSVLDQRNLAGDVYFDGTASSSTNITLTNATTLWHGGIGYDFSDADGQVFLQVEIANKTEDWAAIGTSKHADDTITIFSSYLQHTLPATNVGYSTYPGTASESAFASKNAETSLTILDNTASLSALWDNNYNTAMSVYWQAGSVDVAFSQEDGRANFTLACSGIGAVIYRMDAGCITVADPTQTQSTLEISLSLSSEGDVPADWGDSSVRSRILTVALPGGGLAGSSATLYL
jgi:hypothetical protein